MARTAAVILADGFEEIEAVTQIDVLRRAEVEVTVAGLGSTRVRGAHGLEITTDTTLDELSIEPDLLVLPGGMPGSEKLGSSDQVVELLRRQHQAGRLIAAICAAPAFAPVKAGVLDGRRATCYPSFENRFNPSTTACQERVVVDGNLITSRGPGTAIEMAIVLVEQLVGPDQAARLKEAMLVE